MKSRSVELGHDEELLSCSLNKESHLIRLIQKRFIYNMWAIIKKNSNYNKNLY